MKSKNIKVAYTTRYPQSGATTVPKIQIEGKWLESLGFSIGSTIRVEYEDGSIHIRTMTEEELAAKEQKELEASITRRRAEIAAMESSLQAAYAALSGAAQPAAMVCEPGSGFQASSTSSSPKSSRK